MLGKVVYNTKQTTWRLMFHFLVSFLIFSSTPSCHLHGNNNSYFMVDVMTKSNNIYKVLAQFTGYDKTQ